jgi:hypothetical protein
MTLQSLFPSLPLSAQEERHVSRWQKLIAAIAADRDRQAKACVAEHLPYAAGERRNQFTVTGNQADPDR